MSTPMPAPVPPNLVIVTLGVRDLARSIAFYQGMGWEQRGDASQGIVWFRTSGSWVGLFGFDELAADAHLEPTGAPLPAYRGVTLAINLPGEGDVDAAFEPAAALGATIVKPATRAPWGGYSGYFADPDGHLWEVAWNPDLPLD